MPHKHDNVRAAAEEEVAVTGTWRVHQPPRGGPPPDLGAPAGRERTVANVRLGWAVRLASWHSCPPLSLLPASCWGVRGLSTTQLPPEDASCLPPPGPRCPPFSWHGSTALSGPFHHFGGYSVHILRWKYLRPVPTATPLDFPAPAPCPPANGAHMYSDAGWRQARPAKNVVGSLPGCRDALKGAMREPAGKAASSSRLEPPQETPSEWEGLPWQPDAAKWHGDRRER